MEDRLDEFLELVRRYEEANGTDPVPDQVNKVCIISNTPELLKTHLQLDVSHLGTFDASRVATEDYLRSRRIFKTTSAGNTHEDDPMEVDASPGKGKEGQSGKGKKGGKQGKDSHTGKGYGEATVEQKQVIRATGLTKQCTDTYRDSHDAIRHKWRRTLAHSFQQFHLPFHLHFVTLDLCCQDSHCDPTAERHSSTCSELHMFRFCACLVNRYSR